MFYVLQAMQSESEWHKEQQYALRSSVTDLAKQLNVRDFKAAKEACELIKKVKDNSSIHSYL